MKYELEFYTPHDRLTGDGGHHPAVVTVSANSNTEIEHIADKWLREKRSEIYRQIHPRMTRSEQNEVLSGLALLLVNISRPVDRDENGEMVFYDRRRSR